MRFEKTGICGLRIQALRRNQLIIIIASDDGGLIYELSVRRSLIARPAMIPQPRVRPRGQPLQRDMYDHLSRALSHFDLIKNMHMTAPDIFTKCATSLGYVWLRDLISAALPPNWSLLRICAVLDHRIKPCLPLWPISRKRCRSTIIPSLLQAPKTCFWSAPGLGSWQCTSAIDHQVCSLFSLSWSPPTHHDENSLFGIELGFEVPFFSLPCRRFWSRAVDGPLFCSRNQRCLVSWGFCFFF